MVYTRIYYSKLNVVPPYICNMSISEQSKNALLPLLWVQEAAQHDTLNTGRHAASFATDTRALLASPLTWSNFLSPSYFRWRPVFCGLPFHNGERDGGRQLEAHGGRRKFSARRSNVSATPECVQISRWNWATYHTMIQCISLYAFYFLEMPFTSSIRGLWRRPKNW